jgi:hypothetical protein
MLTRNLYFTALTWNWYFIAQPGLSHVIPESRNRYRLDKIKETPELTNDSKVNICRTKLHPT